MQTELLEILRCPKTNEKLNIEHAVTRGNRIRSGILKSEKGEWQYVIRDFIPRFVSESNYADSFGMQWKKFSKTQLDSFSGHPISANRFWKATGWLPEEIKGKWVLDAGCGAGRFAEVALNAGAYVVALDYSFAVDACYANLSGHPNLHVVQGDIYELPLAPGSFSFAYSLGVLQHTPDVANAFAALPPMLERGGRLCVDYYEKSLKNVIGPKYWLRPLTRRIRKESLFRFLELAVPVLLPISRILGRIPFFGRILKRFVPVANYEGIYPLFEEELKEWALLDTFDWLSPTYDNPQTGETVRLWMEQAGMKDIQILKAGHLVARGSLP